MSDSKKVLIVNTGRNLADKQVQIEIGRRKTQGGNEGDVISYPSSVLDNDKQVGGGMPSNTPSEFLGVPQSRSKSPFIQIMSGVAAGILDDEERQRELTVKITKPRPAKVARTSEERAVRKARKKERKQKKQHHKH